MFQRLLVPLDGSPCAEQAIPFAARVARTSGGSLVLMRAVDAFADLSWQLPTSPIDLEAAIEAERATARAYLAAIQGKSALAGLDVTTEMIEDKPEQAILSLAQAKNAQLIVMGSHGYKGVKRLVLGSVARAVSRQSPLPVLILRDPSIAAEQPAEAQRTRVIVPLDGSDLAEKILPAAISLSQALSSPLPGQLHLTNVLPTAYLATAELAGEYQATMQDATEGYLNSVIQRLSQEKQNLEMSFSIAQQHDVSLALAETVTTKVDQKSQNIIALATHGRTGVDRLLHSSITEQVMDKTKCPILILACPEK